MKTSPESGVSSPAITRRSVDLPLPLGPSSAVSESLSTLIETSSSATKSPNRFVTLRVSIATCVPPSASAWSSGTASRSRVPRARRTRHRRRSDRSSRTTPARTASASASVRRCRRRRSRPRRTRRAPRAVVSTTPYATAQRIDGSVILPERRERGRAERRGRLLLVDADLAQHRHDLAHDERQRDEQRREQHRREREEHAGCRARTASRRTSRRARRADRARGRRRRARAPSAGRRSR